jgi:hypothetical protein
MVEGELVLNAVKDSSLDSRRNERFEADPLRMTIISDKVYCEERPERSGVVFAAQSKDAPKQSHARVGIASGLRPLAMTGCSGR